MDLNLKARSGKHSTCGFTTHYKRIGAQSETNEKSIIRKRCIHTNLGSNPRTVYRTKSFRKQKYQKSKNIRKKYYHGRYTPYKISYRSRRDRFTTMYELSGEVLRLGAR